MDLQAKKPNALYSDILAAAYEEVSRRIRGQLSLPEASGNTAGPIIVSVDPASTSGPAASAITSPVGTSTSTAADSDAAAAAAFAASLADWPFFPDTIPALVKLSSPELGLKLAVLSNVDRASFAYTRAALERGFAFAAAFTAEEIGSYKLRFFPFFYLFIFFCFALCLSFLHALVVVFFESFVDFFL